MPLIVLRKKGAGFTWINWTNPFGKRFPPHSFHLYCAEYAKPAFSCSVYCAKRPVLLYRFVSDSVATPLLSSSKAVMVLRVVPS